MERFIGWLSPTEDRKSTQIIRHTTLSTTIHRPWYPASLDPKNTRSFLISPTDQASHYNEKWGQPAYFRIKKVGDNECASDIEIIPEEQSRALGVSKLDIKITP